jgi:hypothetical protein
MRFYVLFASSFRYEAAPNISHETVDQQRTLCGRPVSDASTFEPDNNDLEPDCIVCRKIARKIRATKPIEEAQIKCSACCPGHTPGLLQPPCGVHGCECWCNR